MKLTTIHLNGKIGIPTLTRLDHLREETTRRKPNSKYLHVQGYQAKVNVHIPHKKCIVLLS